MRGSDLVDLALEIAPRWLVRAFVIGVLGFVWATGNAAPITWYIQDKASGVLDLALAFTDPFLRELTVAVSPAAPTDLVPTVQPIGRSFE